MQLSAEVRWFWRGAQPALNAWFEGGVPRPGGGQSRVDVYLADPEQVELGIKTRGRKPGLEVKVFVGNLGELRMGSLAATPQLWTKVSSSVLRLQDAPRVSTTKRRWLRKYDTGSSDVHELALGPDEQPLAPGPLPVEGCNVEVSEVRIDGLPDAWTTLAFEAFGPLERLAENLGAAVRHLSAQPFPTVEANEALSYPQFLRARTARPR